MKTYKDFSIEDVNREYFNTDRSGRSAAKALGISFRTFSRILSHLGLKAKGSRSKNPMLRDKEWLKIQYYEKKRSVRDIATEVGSTPGAVHSSLRCLGIKFRTANAALKLMYPNGRFGDKASNWKGGRRSTGKYIRIYSPEHPNVDSEGYVMEHRLVMEKHLGRYLTKDEVVHHKNGDKKDNRIENLELVSDRGSHTREHFERSHVTDLHKIEVDRLRQKLIDAGINPDE